MFSVALGGAALYRVARKEEENSEENCKIDRNNLIIRCQMTNDISVCHNGTNVLSPTNT